MIKAGQDVDGSDHYGITAAADDSGDATDDHEGDGIYECWKNNNVLLRK